MAVVVTLTSWVTTAAQTEISPSTERSLWSNIDTDDSIIHFAGYADSGYLITKGQSDDVFSAKFAPIIHYQYQDWLLFEAEGEFEFERADATETNAALEYAMLDFIINDNLAVVVGRFLSPVGQFSQNLHPSWINKLPTAPIGFSGGHDGAGAAPNVDFGLQARGGFETGRSSRLNYAVFVGNGPDLIVEETEDGDLIIEGYELLAKIRDSNSNKSTGLRLGFLPVPHFEIGVSYNQADAAFSRIKPSDGNTEEEDDHSGDQEILTLRDRSYRVWALDYYYAPPQMKNLVLRGEYVSTRLGSGREDEYDHDAKTWEAWYTQAAYSLANNKVEAVVRYGNFTLPDDSTTKQWAIGMNYLFNSRSIVKAAYEFNSGSQANRIIFQYAYGF